jgi:hypothetical protein
VNEELMGLSLNLAFIAFVGRNSKIIGVMAY